VPNSPTQKVRYFSKRAGNDSIFQPKKLTKSPILEQKSLQRGQYFSKRDDNKPHISGKESTTFQTNKRISDTKSPAFSEKEPYISEAYISEAYISEAYISEAYISYIIEAYISYISEAYICYISAKGPYL